MLDIYERWVGYWVDHAGAPDKFVHTYVGVIIWLLTALVLRKPLRHWLPLLAVFAAEAGNETIDRITHGSWQWHDTLRDYLATIAIPVVLSLALNLDRRLRK